MGGNQKKWPQKETCSNCGACKWVDFICWDWVWASVIGDSDGGNHCLNCFVEVANEKGVLLRREDFAFIDIYNPVGPEGEISTLRIKGDIPPQPTGLASIDGACSDDKAPVITSPSVSILLAVVDHEGNAYKVTAASCQVEEWVKRGARLFASLSDMVDAGLSARITGGAARIGSSNPIPYLVIEKIEELAGRARPLWPPRGEKPPFGNPERDFKAERELAWEYGFEFVNGRGAMGPYWREKDEARIEPEYTENGLQWKRTEARVGVPNRTLPVMYETLEAALKGDQGGDYFP